MSAYFHAHNANRRIGNVLFDIYDIAGGTALGIYAAESETEIADLRAMAGNPASAVEEITQVEYEETRKKKAPHLASLINSQPVSQPVALKAVGVAVEGGRNAERGTGNAELGTRNAELPRVLPEVVDVLTVEDVATGTIPVPTAKRKK